MNSIAPKGLASLRILQILQDYSDENHMLTQSDIIRRLDNDYGIVIERKTVQRNIVNLQTAGYDIVTTRNGCYFAGRQFENSELRLLIDSVLFSKHISANYAKDLINKLLDLGNVYFRKSVKHLHSANDLYHANAKNLFYVIDRVGEAIEQNKQISFVYNDYETDKQLHPLWNNAVVVNPYQLVAANNHYYLVGIINNTDNVIHFRLEKISDLEVLNTSRRDVSQTELHDTQLCEYVNSRPYMYTGKAEQVKLRVHSRLMGELIDSFGDSFTVGEAIDTDVLVTLKANCNDVFDWAMKFGKQVEVLSPQKLRDQICDVVTSMQQKYQRNDDAYYANALEHCKSGDSLILSGVDLSLRRDHQRLTHCCNLWLMKNNINSIGFVKDFKQLRRLFVSNNPIVDLTPICDKVATMRELHLTQTGVNDISVLTQLPDLTHLTLISNPIIDYSPVYSLTGLNYLRIDSHTASQLDLAQIKQNNPRVTVAIRNLDAVEIVPQYDYKYVVARKRVGDTHYDEVTVDDANKRFSVQRLKGNAQSTGIDDFDVFVAMAQHLGYKQVDRVELGANSYVMKKQLRITGAELKILQWCIKQGVASIAEIQSKFDLPFGKANDLVDWMEQKDYIDTFNSVDGKYKVTLTLDEFMTIYGLNRTKQRR